MHYDQILKEHLRKLGMAAGRGSSHSSSASTCRNRRMYVTSPVKQRHEAVRSDISGKPSNPCCTEKRRKTIIIIMTFCLSRGPLPHSTRTSFLRARTIFIHQWTFPFWSLWLRVRTFLYFANGPFSIAKGPLHITCGPFCSSGPFIHNMPSSFPHTRTVFIHQDRVDFFSMQHTFRVQTSLSTIGPVLLHALRARIVLNYKKRTLHIVKGHVHVRAGGPSPITSGTHAVRFGS